MRDFACRREHGNGKFPHASAHFPLSPKSQNREMRQEFIGFRENPSRRKGTQKCKRNTFEMQKVCHFALLAPQGGRQNAKRHTLHQKKCVFWHFCVPSGRPQISRNPMNSLPILRFCDFLESVVFALACARFRMPARTRERKVHARERELSTFPEITESRFETGIHRVSWESQSPRGHAKVQNPHF